MRSVWILALPTSILALLAASAVRAQEPTSVIPQLKVIDTSFIDHNANACTDFFEFANGAWLAHDTIPAAYSSSGVSREMSDRNELVVRSVLDDAMQHRASLPARSTERKLGTFYGSCMDSTAAEEAGISPITPTLARIDAIESRAALIAEIARLQVNGTDVAFGYSADADPHDAAHYLGGVGQGGLGLPDRDYYLKTDPSSDSLRTAYVGHITKLLTLAGETPAAANADAGHVLALETELAKVSLARVAMRDPSATDHPMTFAQFRTLTPDIDWPTYFHAVGLATPLKKVNVAEPDFFKRLDALLRDTPLDEWRAYLRYHAIDSASPWLSTPFVKENFAFSSRFASAIHST
jgi:putative endopeptidase